MTDEEKNAGSIDLVKKNTKADMGQKAESLRDNPKSRSSVSKKERDLGKGEPGSGTVDRGMGKRKCVNALIAALCFWALYHRAGQE